MWTSQESLTEILEEQRQNKILEVSRNTRGSPKKNQELDWHQISQQQHQKHNCIIVSKCWKKIILNLECHTQVKWSIKHESKTKIFSGSFFLQKPSLTILLKDVFQEKRNESGKKQ